MKTYSIPISNIELEDINHGDFIKLKLYSISTKKNRNNSEFLRESFEDGMLTIPNKPILAYYNKNLQDVEEHNSKLDIDMFGDVYSDYQYDGGERPVGVIPESAVIYTETIEDKEWIVIDGALIWVEYNKQLVDLLKKQKKKKVSVEIEVLESYEENDVEKIVSWKFLGITILGKYKDGSKVEEGIEGAHLVLKDFAESDKFQTFKKKMSYALNGDKMSILSKYGLGEVKKMSLTMNELHNKIDGVLNDFYYTLGEYQYRKYWIRDILFEEYIVIVDDSEVGAFYAIPYSVSEDGFVTVDMNGKKEASTHYDFSESTIEKHEVFLAKNERGTGEAIPVDKSKEAVSDDSWGSVNKTALRNEVLKAKNYKTLVKSVYLVVEDGWEDSPSSKLKYPVMQIKDGKAVYNSNGLVAAQRMGEAHDEAVASKAKRIRKKLGLLDNEKEKREKMNKYIDMAREAGLVFLGSYNGKFVFAHDCEDEADKENMSVFEIDKEKCATLACDGEEDKDFKWDELTEKSLKMADDEDSDDDEDEDEDEAPKEDSEKEEMKRELSELKASFEEKCKELDSMKKEKMKEDTDAILSDENEDIDEKTKEDLKKMRDEGKFKDVDEFKRELAFCVYEAKKVKERETKEKHSFATFGIKNNKSINSDKNESNGLNALLDRV